VQGVGPEFEIDTKPLKMRTAVLGLGYNEIWKEIRLCLQTENSLFTDKVV
jgi:hypothetical protein